MNRLLIHFSATTVIVACALTAYAGPSAPASRDGDVSALAATGSAPVAGPNTLPSPHALLAGMRQDGFALGELAITPHGDRTAPGYASGSFGWPNQRISVDVSDFIPASWQQSDASVDRLARPSDGGEELAFSDFALAVSADVKRLSVPEVPLPIPLIPGMLGVGLAVIAHRRSLHRRN